jgi:hypothetical protein
MNSDDDMDVEMHSIYQYSNDEDDLSHSSDGAEEEEEGEGYDEWSDANTYIDLLRLNIDFIDGKTEGTPYHHAPLHIDSQLLKSELVKLNQLGFFSHDGQGKVNSIVHSNNELDDLPWKQTQQIPYIDLIMPNQPQYHRFLDLVKQNKKLNWIIRTNFTALETNLSPGRFIVTRQRRARTKQALSSTEWVNYTGMYSDNGVPGWQECFSNHSNPSNIMEAMNPISAFIAYTSFNCRRKIGLEQLLLDLAQQAGIRSMV